MPACQTGWCAASAREHDEVRALAGLGTKSLVRDDQRGAGRHQFGNALERIRRNSDAIERFTRRSMPACRMRDRLDVLALSPTFRRRGPASDIGDHVPAHVVLSSLSAKAVNTCVPSGRSGCANVTGASNTGSKPLRTNSLPSLRLMKTEIGPGLSGRGSTGCELRSGVVSRGVLERAGHGSSAGAGGLEYVRAVLNACPSRLAVTRCAGVDRHCRTATVSGKLARASPFGSAGSRLARTGSRCEIADGVTRRVQR